MKVVVCICSPFAGLLPFHVAVFELEVMPANLVYSAESRITDSTALEERKESSH